GVTAETLAKRFGISVDQLSEHVTPAASGTTAMPAPGMMKEHYSPKTPLRLHSADRDVVLPRRSGRIAFQKLDPIAAARYLVVETLSESGDLDEVARGLFA